MEPTKHRTSSVKRKGAKPKCARVSGTRRTSIPRQFLPEKTTQASTQTFVKLSSTDGDVTTNGKSAITTILMVVGFLFMLSVPAILTYVIMKRNIATEKTTIEAKTTPDYKIINAVSTANMEQLTINHENLQKFIDNIGSTIAEYERLSK